MIFGLLFAYSTSPVFIGGKRLARPGLSCWPPSFAGRNLSPMYTALGVQRPLLTSAQPLPLCTQVPTATYRTKGRQGLSKRRGGWRQAASGLSSLPCPNAVHLLLWPQQQKRQLAGQEVRPGSLWTVVSLPVTSKMSREMEELTQTRLQKIWIPHSSDSSGLQRRRGCKWGLLPWTSRWWW